MPSEAFTTFSGKKKDSLIQILNLFDEINKSAGRNKNYEILNGALILLIANWEAYCEDVCGQAVKKITEKTEKFADLPKRMQKKVLEYAFNTYKKDDNNKDPLNQEMAKLPDGNWRDLLMSRLASYVFDFNTPKFSRKKGKNLNDLFEWAIGIKNISSQIDSLLEEDEFCNRLDAVVSLRGHFAHGGGGLKKDKLSSNQLRNHVDSFVEAATAIDVIIYNDFKEKFNSFPWRSSRNYNRYLRDVAKNKLQTQENNG